MNLSKLSHQLLIVFFVIFGQHCLQAHATGFDTPLLEDLKAIAGEYKGAVRLQNSSGTVDQLLVSDARLSLDIQKDSLIVMAPEGFTGTSCHSQVGGIRELIRISNQSQILKVVFDYDTSRCPAEKKWKSLVVFLNQEPDGSLVAETLLTQGPVDLVANSVPSQALNVHGFFTKKPRLSISQR